MRKAAILILTLAPALSNAIGIWVNGLLQRKVRTRSKDGAHESLIHQATHEAWVREQAGENNGNVTRPKSNTQLENYAYVTMWYSGARTFNQSLNQTREANNYTSNPRGIVDIAIKLWKYSKYPLVVVTNNINYVFDKNEFPNVIVVPIESANLIHLTCAKKKNRWTYTYQKLQIFNLFQYDKLLWLDADIEIKRNIDYIFNFDLHDGNTIWAQELSNKCDDPPQCFFSSGALLFKPSNNLFKRLMVTGNTMNLCMHDQQILNEFFCANKKNNYTVEHFPRKTLVWNSSRSCENNSDMVHFPATNWPFISRK